MSQECVLFARSIAENIKYGSEHATDDDMYRAAKMAAIHDEIINFPNGYQTGVANISYHICHLGKAFNQSFQLESECTHS